MHKNLKEPEIFLHRILLEETEQPWERTGIRGKSEKVAESRDRLQEKKIKDGETGHIESCPFRQKIVLDEKTGQAKIAGPVC